MTEGREWLVQWLRDAHAMEDQAETMLNAQLSRIENYPELAERIRQHIEENQGSGHASEDCSRRLRRRLLDDEGRQWQADGHGPVNQRASSPRTR